jgi:hypothetical protein
MRAAVHASAKREPESGERTGSGISKAGKSARKPRAATTIMAAARKTLTRSVSHPVRDAVRGRVCSVLVSRPRILSQTALTGGASIRAGRVPARNQSAARASLHHLRQSGQLSR